MREVNVGLVSVVRNGAEVRQSPIVVHCCGYGMTCGELGTTNGSIRMVTQLLLGNANAVERHRHDLDDQSFDFLVEIDGQRRDLTAVSEGDLFCELRGIYQRELAAEKACNANPVQPA